MQLLNKLILSANKGLLLQNNDGSMPQGHNGPWYDELTPLRNTAHWAILFVFVFKKTRDIKYLNAAKMCGDYLISPSTRPNGESFYCRNSSSKDQCNGLIGQAWVMEALIILSEELKDNRYFSCALNVFNKHGFDVSRGLWKIKHVNGENGEVCRTFNQQLWFAAVGAMINSVKKNSEIELKINLFKKNLFKNIRITDKGRIKHLITYHRFFLWKLAASLKEYLIDGSHQKDLSIGYHSFNLYGFALLYKYSGKDKFWEVPKNKKRILKVLNYINTAEYLVRIKSNKYGSQYNPSGIEISFALLTFKAYLNRNIKESVSYWLNDQFERHYSIENGLMNKNTVDEETLAARLYEAVRIIEFDD